VLIAGWLGLVAGFAVAIPLGPIGLLIVDRGIRHGRSAGLAAAAGVAATDLAYGVLALTATTWATRVIEPIARPSTYLAAAVIAAIGLRGLLQRREPPTEDRRAAAASQAPPARPARTFVGFAALTAINPATVLAFTALTAALTDRLDSLVAFSCSSSMRCWPRWLSPTMNCPGTTGCGSSPTTAARSRYATPEWRPAC
jgi:threonine/homoserine/homoserine lactone efflux protein